MAASTAKALSTFKSFLMKGTVSGDNVAWTKLVDIKSYPDIGPAPEKIDVSTLSDPSKVYIKGCGDSGDMSFKCNYTLSDYKTLKTMEEADTETDLAIWFGGTLSNGTLTATGEDGKFEFKGTLAVTVNGGDYNNAREMTVTVYNSTTPKQTAT